MNRRKRALLLSGSALALLLVGGLIFLTQQIADAPKTEPQPEQVTKQLPTFEAPVAAASEEVIEEPQAIEEIAEEGVADENWGRGPGRIFGRVEMPDNLPMPPDMTLSLRLVKETTASREPRVQTADAEGKFEFAKLPLKDFSLYASSTGYTYHYAVTLSKERTERELTIKVVPGGSISGSVIGEQGSPVPEAEVLIAGWNQTGASAQFATASRALSSLVVADENGQFVMPNLWLSNDPGYRLMARAEGYAPTITDYYRAGAEEVVIAIVPGATFAGQLLVEESGEPLASREITFGGDLAWNSPKATTDPEGWFFLANLAPWLYTAQLEDKEYVLTPETAKVTVAVSAANETILLAVKGGAIEGRVIQEENAAGLSGITIEARTSGSGVQPRQAIAQTDGSGKFRLAGLPEGSYLVGIQEAPGFAESETRRKRQNVFVHVSETVTIADIALKRGNLLGGRVLNREGEAVVGANVYASSRGRGDDSKTDAGGRYTLAGLPDEGPIYFHASATGFASHTERFEGVHGNRLAHDVVMYSEARVEGIIVNDKGQPQAGLIGRAQEQPRDPNASRGGMSSESGADGTFTIERLSPGTYSLNVTRRDGPMLAELSGSSTQTVTVREGETVSGIRMVFRQTGLSLTGLVLDPQGMAVSDANISAMLDGRGLNRTKSDEQGRFSIDGLKDYTYYLKATKTGFSPSTEVPAQAGQKNVTLTLVLGGAISGQVVDATSGAPIPTFTISMSGSRQDVRDVNGLFRLTGISGTRGLINVNSEGRAPLNQAVAPLSPGEERAGLLLQMEAAQTVTGTVFDEAGQPVKGAQVAAGGARNRSWPGSGLSGATTDQSGRFELTGFAAGPARISAHLKGYLPADETVTIGQGELTGIRLVLARGVTLQGHITLDGEPLPSAGISVTHNERDMQNAGNSDSAGFYRIDALQPGPSIVEIYPGNGRGSRVVPFMIDTGQDNVFDIDFSDGSAAVFGSVIPEPGQAIGTNQYVGIYIRDANGTTHQRGSQADVSGRYRVEGLPPGKGMIYTHTPIDSRMRAFDITLIEDEEKEFDLQLSGGASLRCRVSGFNETDGYGYMQLFSGVHQITRIDNSLYREMQVYQRGSARVWRSEAVMRNVEPGTYTAVLVHNVQTTGTNGIIQNPEPNFVYRHIDVKEGEETVFDLSL